ncbi:MAG: type II toxin-antitoxin system VapC family toxin [Candidatus Methanomethylicota archaeon]|uniref:Type II toxin-antitoxin system VapC family toxin n=1 Tax=Thermoproteota archaeon TaxID=2056631 RepID=A0A497EM95_9CREN|nr:MAG: type II toxin-antitoxin system VapC family toxin [Candidatus Verstraetearchaeota archaeon]RLE52313.1 MAG: type II toxin-antitoxin system VapC family toxin [Candidatus Verstraetearchaeota archaeon]
MEEVLYDTSYLIEEYRHGVRELDGYTTVLNIVEFPKALGIRRLKVIYPSVEDFDEAIKVSKDLLKIGKPLPAVDILIAAIALKRALTLKTRDEHFKLVKEVRPYLKLELL